MKSILSKISHAVDAYEQEWGHPPREIRLPLYDAQDLAAIDVSNNDGEALDDTIDDVDEQNSQLAPAALEGMEFFGAVIHVDPTASVITCG